MSHSIYAYAWDLLDANVGKALTPLKNAGIDSLTVALSYHAGKFIAPWRAQGRVIFPDDGTVYFEPQSSCYGELRPEQAACTQGIDVLERLQREFSLPVHAWTVLLHNTRLGMLHPECTVRNAFGDRYPYSLCPAHPAVVQYAVGLCTDIATRDVAGIKLETPGYLPYAHGFHHEFAQLAPNLWLENLLGLCFCVHCQSRARERNVDAEQLRRRVLTLVDQYLQSATEANGHEARQRWFELLASEPQLDRYLAIRCEIVSDLLRVARAAIASVRPDIDVRVIPTVQQPHRHARFEGSDLAAQSAIVDRLEIPLYQSTVGDCVADARYVREQIGTDAPLSAIVRPGYPDMSDSSQLLDTLRALAAEGITEVSFYNLGLLRPINHRWIRDALARLE